MSFLLLEQEQVAVVYAKIFCIAIRFAGCGLQRGEPLIVKELLTMIFL